MNEKTQTAIHNQLLSSTNDLLNIHWHEIVQALDGQDNVATVNVSFKIDVSKPVAQLKTGISFYTGKVKDEVESSVDANQLELL